MIGSLRGQLIEISSDGTLLVDVGGVGYEVLAPLGTPGRCQASMGESIALTVHTHVREDALLLYGFATPAERTAFRTLIGISKVGPKLALAVLSGLGVDDLAHAVQAGQAARLTAIAGIGKKTAERMVLELQGKLSAAGPAPTVAIGDQGDSETSRILTEALLRMGFKAPAVERAVAAMTDFDRPMAELIREALSQLST